LNLPRFDVALDGICLPRRYYLSCKANIYQMSSPSATHRQETPKPGGSVPTADQRLARETWHRLLRISSRTLRDLDAALDRSDRLSVNEFDVLITLDNAPERGLRMSDLARAAMLSSGGLTRLVERLEERGMVRRVPDPSDAR
jgi:MarR family